MKPYSHLDIPHDLITHRLKQLVKRNGIIENGTFVNSIGLEQTHKEIPELKGLFNSYGLNDLRGLLIIRALPASVAPNYPHTDTMPSPDMKVAINWPVLNCQDTFTAFYEPKPDALPVPTKLVNGLPYTKYEYNDVVETHRMRITVPTAIRYDVLHAVINNTSSVRITASFRFDSNHWELFKD